MKHQHRLYHCCDQKQRQHQQHQKNDQPLSVSDNLNFSEQGGTLVRIWNNTQYLAHCLVSISFWKHLGSSISNNILLLKSEFLGCTDKNREWNLCGYTEKNLGFVEIAAEFSAIVCTLSLCRKKYVIRKRKKTPALAVDLWRKKGVVISYTMMGERECNSKTVVAIVAIVSWFCLGHKIFRATNGSKTFSS